eukprot:CAMPEP_0171489184 /NCGR_PEP_ID=MMETSP0958-20121227/2615_1 /TAXON_ID=87120 /ORGANISM="Aurantiochytrium limacinum, Strain ATCCMYA-1381" /LENGTH=126 /DNA_ID=CAMNT_0012022367 /DNA_START=159 /DNA_END=539 /DNA_ORIENTATION=+
MLCLVYAGFTQGARLGEKSATEIAKRDLKKKASSAEVCPKKMAWDLLEPCPPVCVKSSEKEAAIAATVAASVTCELRYLEPQCACKRNKVLLLNTQTCMKRSACKGEYELVQGEIAGYSYQPLTLE